MYLDKEVVEMRALENLHKEWTLKCRLAKQELATHQSENDGKIYQQITTDD